MKNKLIYVASPYYHDNPYSMVLRAEAVANACYTMLRCGYNPISPIAHWHPMKLQGCKFEDVDDDLVRVNITLLKKCDMLLVLQLGGWEQSKGIIIEVAQARKLNIEVRYVKANEFMEMFGGTD